MSNELTDVRCPCGDEYPADSYDAGFIAGSGMCQNCDAALPPKDICTCPSGDGSLVHPCPAHPAPVEQAGGDERDFQAKGAQEVPSPVSKEYDRHLIGLLRKGEALPGHQEEAADEIERLRDWNDHLNNTVLPNILNPNFLMLMKGGERLLDLCTKDGKFIGVSLNDMKDVFDWMVTHARIAPDHAALAQPSPVINYALLHAYACENSIDYNALCATVRDSLEQPSPAPDIDPLNLAPHAGAFNEAPAEALKPEQAEAERPEVVAVMKSNGAGGKRLAQRFPIVNVFVGDELMTVAQHERIVKAWIERWKAYIELSAKIAAQRDAANNRLHEVATACATAEQERDAALAKLAELEAKLSDPTAVHQWQFSNAWFDGSEEVVLKAGKEGSPIRTLYAAPVAQAQHSVPDGYRLIRLEHFAAIKAQLDPKQVDAYRGRNIYDEDKVYANWNECRSALDEIKDVFQQIDWDAENELAELLAAAPGKSVPQAWLDVQAERRRQVEAEGWTPEHDDAHSYGQMARAAACYALAGSSAPNDGTAALLVSLAWPWDEQWWKPTSTRRDLVKACALALAEIERLDRAAAPGKEGL